MSEQNEDLLSAVLDMKSDVGYIRGKVESIETQTKKTNGRVTRDETRINYIIIALVVIAISLAFSNPFFDKILNFIPIK